MFANLIVVMVFSYLLGSLPYGLIFVKIFKKQDIREIGSHNIGATNVLRAGYPILALFTLLCDALKGAIAVLTFKYFLLFPETNINFYAVAGIFAMLGHIFPIWLKFKGGKGVATAFGTIIAINPLIGLLCFASWLISAVIFRYSSLSAIIAVFLFPLWAYFLDTPIFYYAVVMAILILAKHKDNFIRLYRKEETKIKFKSK